MADNDVNKQNLKRLDVLVMLTLDNPETLPMSKKILRLLSLGFTQSEVASIIGKKLKYVTSIVSQEKKRAQREKNKKNK